MLPPFDRASGWSITYISYNYGSVSFCPLVLDALINIMKIDFALRYVP